MDFALESSVFNRPTFVSTIKNSFFLHQNRCSKFSVKISPRIHRYPKCHVLGALVFGVLVFGCKRVFAVESAVNAGYGDIGQGILLLKNAWIKVSQVLRVFKEQGLVLAALLGLSAFLSMAETSITTLWPWKVVYGVCNLLLHIMVAISSNSFICSNWPFDIILNQVRELADKEPDNGVFKMLHSDVTRFLTTILTGMIVANVGATALVTEAATALFCEAGVSAATGIMTVGCTGYRWLYYFSMNLLQKVLQFIMPQRLLGLLSGQLAWFSMILYPVGRVITYLSMGMLKALGLKGRRLTMYKLVPSLVDFHSSWVTHQYSRQINSWVPVLEQCVDNIVGIAYAMYLLDNVQKGDLLESTTVGDMAHKPAYFVPDSMSVWNLLGEFCIRKEEIQKKTGYIVMQAEEIYDVDANTCIDQLSEDLNIKMPEGHQYEMVSGFICEAFGYIPRTGESTKVILYKENQEENEEHDDLDLTTKN
ncbi:hypothetical protein Patl1_03999 [Pistacia atlantica]|uniref:Uncharacterized protein n=1 Tax=Pistacia atlantica TaxID=434234 RepID=A0ACC1BX74_9ROSI|nr:hypothetical protein Patl1_03999 [Pistacia atlantica]